MPFPFRRILTGSALALSLAACEAPVATGTGAEAPAPSTPAPTAPAPAPAPSTGLTRAGEQVITLDIINGTDTAITGLSRVAEGRAGPNLLAAGQIIPPGERAALPAAAGSYLLRAELQSAGVFQPGRVVTRNIIVPRFPPGPPPRMPVTIR